MFFKLFSVVHTNKITDVLCFLQRLNVCIYYLRVICNHRAVEMVISEPLVEVIGHTGVEDGVYRAFEQLLYVSVEKLCRVAYRIRGDCVLTLEVNFPVGNRRNNYVEPEFSEES